MEIASSLGLILVSKELSEDLGFLANGVCWEEEALRFLISEAMGSDYSFFTLMNCSFTKILAISITLLASALVGEEKKSKDIRASEAASLGELPFTIALKKSAMRADLLTSVKVGGDAVGVGKISAPSFIL